MCTQAPPAHPHAGPPGIARGGWGYNQAFSSATICGRHSGARKERSRSRGTKRAQSSKGELTEAGARVRHQVLWCGRRSKYCVHSRVAHHTCCGAHHTCFSLARSNYNAAVDRQSEGAEHHGDDQPVSAVPVATPPHGHRWQLNNQIYLKLARAATCCMLWRLRAVFLLSACLLAPAGPGPLGKQAWGQASTRAVSKQPQSPAWPYSCKDDSGVPPLAVRACVVSQV